MGETYKLPEGTALEMCVNGFHFCETQQDVLRYYDYGPNFVLLEIEALGEVITREDKSVTDELRVIRVAPREEYEFMEGNTIRHETSDGVWWTKEYDARGNMTRYEDFCGVWRTYEYDDQGRVVRYEDSDGNWWTREYDDQGRKVRVEDSDGVLLEVGMQVWTLPPIIGCPRTLSGPKTVHSWYIGIPDIEIMIPPQYKHMVADIMAGKPWIYSYDAEPDMSYVWHDYFLAENCFSTSENPFYKR